MGLFSKSSKRKPQYLNVDLTDYNIKWDDFSEALPSIIDAGSRDVKKSEFRVPGAAYQVFTYNGKIKGVLPPSSPFTVREHLRWLPEDAMAPEVKEKLLAASSSNDLYQYDKLAAQAPEAKDYLKQVFAVLQLEASLGLKKAMSGHSVEILTEPIFSEEMEASVLAWDFFDKTSDEVLEEVERLDLRRNHALDRMGLKDFLASPFTAREPWEATTLSELYLRDKVEQGEVVRDLLFAGQQGVLTSTLLETFERLFLNKNIAVEGVREEEEEALPEFDLLETEAEAPKEEESMFTDVELEEMPVSEDDEDAEWSFEEDILDGEDDHPHFIPTGFTNVNLRPLIYPLIKEYELSDDEKRKVRAHLRKNAALEKEVLALEDKIEPLSRSYSHGVEVYDEMKFNKSLTDLENDNEDPTESEVESVDNAPAMVEQRDEANNDFFTLAKLEEERYRVNEARKKELYGLLGSVPFEGEDQRTIDLQDTLEAKLRGIDHVRTIAFHAPVDVRGHDKLVAELVNDEAIYLGEDESREEEAPAPEEKPSYIIDIDAPDPRPTSTAFIYYQLVDEWGEDPIELYKEDMRIKRDGGNPYIPRETKYSKKLTAEWRHLQDEQGEKSQEESAKDEE